MATATVRRFEAEGVRGVWHSHAGVARGGLILAHGAGSDCDAPLLVAAASAFSAAGWRTLRLDLPFRQRRPSGPPPRGSGPADRDGLRRAVETMRSLLQGPIVLGGHSYGGRQATMAAAEDAGVADALLLLSYPLHPPRKPDELRTEHFPRLRIPAVFVHGSSDPFGSPAELEAAVLHIPAFAKLVIVPGAGHDLKGGRIDFAPAIGALSGGLG